MQFNVVARRVDQLPMFACLNLQRVMEKMEHCVRFTFDFI